MQKLWWRCNHWRWTTLCLNAFLWWSLFPVKTSFIDEKWYLYLQVSWEVLSRDCSWFMSIAERKTKWLLKSLCVEVRIKRRICMWFIWACWEREGGRKRGGERRRGEVWREAGIRTLKAFSSHYSISWQKTQMTVQVKIQKQKLRSYKYYFNRISWASIKQTNKEEPVNNYWDLKKIIKLSD